jgi:hypothetical protein
VRSGPSSIWAVPILFSKSGRYDPSRGGEFFDYLEFKFLVVQKADSHATYDPSRITSLDASQLQDFYEQVGRNTDYIVHPEEIIADNFEFLLIGKPNLPSPEIQRNPVAALHQQ